MTDYCPGRAHKWEPDELKPAPQPVICRPCQETALNQLRRIPYLAETAAAMPGGKVAQHAHAGRTMHARLSEAPSPAPAFDLADELYRWPLAWVDTLNFHLSRPLAPSMTCARAVAELVEYASALFASPWALDFADDVRQTVSSAEKLTGTDRLVHQLPGTCPDCHCKSLRRVDGQEHVFCRVCKKEWSWDKYRADVRALTQAWESAK